MDPLELELQADVSCLLMRVPGLKLRFSLRHDTLLTTELSISPASSLHHFFFGGGEIGSDDLLPTPHPHPHHRPGIHYGTEAGLRLWVLSVCLRLSFIVTLSTHAVSLCRLIHMPVGEGTNSKCKIETKATDAPSCLHRRIIKESCAGAVPRLGLVHSVCLGGAQAFSPC